MLAGWVADGLLLLHCGVAIFVVGGQLLIVLGAFAGWRWVRTLRLRMAHALTIAYIVLQTWLGTLCPLTVWEMQLRQAAGQGVYDETFIEHWLGRLLYVQAPWWVFVIAYSVFGALVAASWYWVPPTRRH